MKDFKLNEGEKIKSGFNTPNEDYFTGLSEKLIQQLPVQEPAVIPLYRRKPVWMGAAAAFILMMGTATFMINNSSTKRPDAAAIESYLVYDTNISAYDIGQHLDDADIKELEGSLAVSDDAIENYLLYNDISE